MIYVCLFSLGFACSRRDFGSKAKEETPRPEAYIIEEDPDAMAMLADFWVLDPGERLDLAQKILDDQRTRLGLPYPIKVNAETLSDGVGAHYLHGEKQITVQAPFLNQLPLEKFLHELTHECAHSEQHNLLSIHDYLGADAENIVFRSNDTFALLDRYEYELLNYTSGTVDESAYARQALEQVAEIWADQETRLYLELLEGVRTVRLDPVWPVTLEKKDDRRMDALKSYLTSLDKNLYPYFALKDLTDDGFPEAILISGSTHLNGLRFVFCSGSGETVTSPEIGSFGELQYSPEKKVILAKYGNHGAYWNYPFLYSEGTLSLLSDAFYEDRSGEVPEFYLDTLNGEKLSINYSALFDRPVETAVRVSSEDFQNAFENVFGHDLITLPDSHVYVMNEKEIDLALETIHEMK